VLAQRGVTQGHLLLLSGQPLDQAAVQPAAHFQLTRATLAEAATLLSSCDFAAVVLVADDAGAASLEPSLARLAPLLSAGTLLVITAATAWQASHRRTAGATPHPSDPREALHLLLLRHGFHELWAHAWRAIPCISARRTAAAAPRTCSIIVPVFNEKQTFPELMRRLLARPLDHL
jgi:hypothetical protein